ncbi:MAG TPA: alpha/beta fold hydrolase [Solirubrobacteraceae bacterium]|jgi:pimeloyl-ACP methyl ester carboxylesterase/DNA-binding CsgD family transcriptional regulator
MDQRIGFCPVQGGRIAYAVTGDGPPLIMPAWWVSHLEVDWQTPGFRAFVEALSAHRTVIRYDKLGCGLSDRERPPDQFTLDHEVGVLEALVEEVGAEAPAMLAVSCAGCIATSYALRNPVSSLVFAASYADGTRLTEPAVERLIIAAVRTHWGMGSRMLADIFMGGATEEERREYDQFQRASATPEMAAELLELVYSVSVVDLVPKLDVPALVVNRRGDEAVPFERGRELASLLPGARFVPLDGDAHLPWTGQAGTIVELILRFLDGDEAPSRAPASNGDEVLSARERDVLRLVASGLSDTQIAESLVLSPHTVHRHVANIRTKLRQPTRGAAAAEAARRGLI